MINKMRNSTATVSLFFFLLPFASAQITPNIWKKFIGEPVPVGTPDLIDFSYAGYKNGEEAIPEDFAYTVYNVTNYGATPNDGKSDTAAIEKVLKAAAVGRSIVFFPPGHYDVLLDGEDRKPITISGDNVIIRGSGAEGAAYGGTTIKMHNNLAEYKRLFETRWRSNGQSRSTSVKGSFPRGTRYFDVESVHSLVNRRFIEIQADGLRETDWSQLSCRPIESMPRNGNEYENIRSGIDVYEIHEIDRIDGNRVYVKAPVLTHLNPNFKVNWRDMTVGVGFEDLHIDGNLQESYVHLKQVGRGGITLLHTAHSWIRRCRFSNTVDAMGHHVSYSNSALGIILDGRYGHIPGKVTKSTYCFIGLLEDHTDKGMWHGITVGSFSAGTVVWEIRGKQMKGPDTHGSQPRHTLFDNYNSINHQASGGAVENLPHHLDGYTRWNNNVADNSTFDLWNPGRHNFAVTQANLIGYKTSGDPIPDNACVYVEEFGTRVFPDSLYEAQLQRRLGALPAWVDASKNQYSEFFERIFSASTQTSTPPIDDGGHLPASKPSLSPGLPYSVLTHQRSTVLSVAFNPKESNILACGLSDGRIQVWDTSKHTLQYILYEYKDLIFSLAFSPDGRTLASGNADGTLRLWDVDTGKRRILLTEHTDIVTSLTFSDDGSTLASGSADGTIRLWNPDGEQKNVLQGYEVPVSSLAFSPTDNMLVTGRADNIIRVWDLGTGTLRHILFGHEGPVISLAFSLDGSTLASGSADTTVRLWDMSKDKTEKTLTAHTTLTEHTDWVNSVAFNSTLLASGSHDKTICLWNANTGDLQHTLTAHTGSVESVAFNTGVAFNADGNTLASGGADGRVLLWKLAPAPDLVVESVTADKITLDPGETFTLTATLKNRGIGRAEAPIYYRWHRSTHPNIHKMGGSDKVLTRAREEIGEKRTAVRSIVELKKTEDVSLGTNQSSKQYIVLTAPQEPDTYYYSVCVESPLNESDDCSADVEITVQSPVNIPDLNLRAVIEKELSKNPGATITATDMQTITDLNAKGKSIVELTGLEFAINLEKLDLSNNQISDVSPLAGLTKLEELDISDNRIKAPLYFASLENLTTLNISKNPIKFDFDVALLTSKKNLKLDLTPYETANVFGSTIYYDSNGNKTVLIKGLKLDNPKFNDSNLDYTDYLPPEQGNHFEIYEQDGNTCGHYSALMLLHYYGVKFNTLKLGTKSGEKLGEETFGKLSSFFAMDSLLPGQTRNEMKRGLSKSLPVDIEHFSADEYSSTQNPDEVLRDMVSQSRPPILLIRLGDLNLHYVIAVGYDTKTDKFLIADPNGYFYWLNYYTRTDKIPISGSTKKKTCRPALKEAWGLESEVQASCDIDGESLWKLGAPLGDFADFFESDYQMFVPKEAPSYHHLKSETYYIKEEGKRARNPFTKSDFKVEFHVGGKVEHCAQFFVKKDGADVFVKCEPGDNKVVVSGTIENGWVNINDVGIGMVEMFLTVYYESSGGATHSAPSIALSAPSITTTLLPNYPNPFNPETWIPYQLAEPADVALTIHDIQGRVVRDLDLGHQRVGMYHSRSRAAHWDGRNAQGESVASGIYFYTLKAGDFRATRKLLIRK